MLILKTTFSFWACWFVYSISIIGNVYSLVPPFVHVFWCFVIFFAKEMSKGPCAQQSSFYAACNFSSSGRNFSIMIWRICNDSLFQIVICNIFIDFSLRCTNHVLWLSFLLAGMSLNAENFHNILFQNKTTINFIYKKCL